MKAVFVELPAFERHRSDYLDDAAFAQLQTVLMEKPDGGRHHQGHGRHAKARFAGARRSKGKRGGLRVIYYWWNVGFQFWLFTMYGKDELGDLTPQQCKALKTMIKAELEARRNQ